MWKWLYGANLVKKADRLGTYAAALAYCFVLSLVPFLVVTFTLASDLAPRRLNLDRAFKELLGNILPTENATETLHIFTAVERTSHGGLVTAGFILALYTSYNLMMQIVRTLLFIFDDPRRGSEWSGSVAVKTLSLFAIWMLLLFVLSACSVPKSFIQSILIQFYLPYWWIFPCLVIRDFVMVASLFGAFFLTYFLVPTKRYKMRSVREGSLVATTGWMLCSLLFSGLLPRLWQMNAVYEALGSVVIVLLWAQACAWSIIAGACWMVRFPSRRP